MRQLTIKKGTSGKRNDAYSNHCQNVINGLSGNPSYPNPVVPMADVQEKLNLFGELVVKSFSANGSAAITLEKNNLQKEIERDMDALFGFVKSKGYTDIVILTSSGFPLSKTPDPVHNIGQCQGFTIKVGPAQGECSLKVKKLRGAQSYIFQCTETVTPETNNWMIMPSGDTTQHVTGLTSGTRYTFRVCAVHRNDIGPWSTYLTSYIL